MYICIWQHDERAARWSESDCVRDRHGHRGLECNIQPSSTRICSSVLPRVSGTWRRRWRKRAWERNWRKDTNGEGYAVNLYTYVYEDLLERLAGLTWIPVGRGTGRRIPVGRARLWIYIYIYKDLLECLAARLGHLRKQTTTTGGEGGATPGQSTGTAQAPI